MRKNLEYFGTCYYSTCNFENLKKNYSTLEFLSMLAGYIKYLLSRIQWTAVTVVNWVVVLWTWCVTNWIHLSTLGDASRLTINKQVKGKNSHIYITTILTRTWVFEWKNYPKKPVGSLMKTEGSLRLFFWALPTKVRRILCLDSS